MIPEGDSTSLSGQPPQPASESEVLNEVAEVVSTEPQPETLGSEVDETASEPEFSGQLADQTDVHRGLVIEPGPFSAPDLPAPKRPIAEPPGARTMRFAAVVLGKLEKNQPLTPDDEEGLSAVRRLAARIGFISPAQATLAPYENDPFYKGAFYRADPATRTAQASWSEGFKRTYEMTRALQEYLLACTASGVPDCQAAAIATFFRPDSK